jgi:hypothetical protein
MKLYQQRLLEEQTQLAERIGKLEQFFNTGMFDKLDREEGGRMLMQLEVMTHYYTILKERIRFAGIK